jgi:hypothetical protein
MAHKEDVGANYNACLFSLGVNALYSFLSLALMLVFVPAQP